MSTVTTFLNLVKPAPLEAFSRATYNNNLDLIDADALAKDKQAKGLLLKKRITGSAAAPGTTVAVIENFASVSLKAGRHYRVAWHINNYTGTANGTYINASINTASVADAAASTANLTAVESNTLVCVDSRYGQSTTVFGYIDPAADTTVQIKFTAQVVVGTAGAMNAYVCTIEDMGLQF